MKQSMVGLCVVVITGLIFSQMSLAKSIYVTNGTNFPAEVSVDYATGLCRSEKKRVMAGETGAFKVPLNGACLLTDVGAVVEEGGDIIIGQGKNQRVYRTTDSSTGRTKQVKADPYKSTGTWYHVFHIGGPELVPVMKDGKPVLDTEEQPVYQSRYFVSRTTR